MISDVLSTQMPNCNKKRRTQKSRVIFIVVMLAIPVINWLVFWLFVNVQTIARSAQ